MVRGTAEGCRNIADTETAAQRSDHGSRSEDHGVKLEDVQKNYDRVAERYDKWTDLVAWVRDVLVSRRWTLRA